MTENGQSEAPLRLIMSESEGGPTSSAAGSSPPPLQEFFIPVHGLVRLHEDELPIVNHPAFQRLGFVYQLGQTYLVYRGATHTRLEHALGTRYVAELMIDALKRNCSEGQPNPDRREGDWQLDVRLSETEERFVRLGALLHDIGHLPAGHTLEDELGLLGSHDQRERLQLIFDRKVWSGVEVEQTLREVIDEHFGADAVATGLRNQKTDAPLSATEVVELLVSKEPPLVIANPDFRHGVCRDIIGNTICADLFDYLHRDWYHIGKPRFFDTRLFEYLEIRARETSGAQREANLVINLRSGHRVRTDAVTAILDLLESRYQLAEIALFHRTKLSAAAMLERAIAEIGDHYPSGMDGLLAELPEVLLDSTDTEMLDRLGERAQRALDETGPAETGKRAALQGALRLTKSLRLRRLHEVLGSAFEYELPRAAKQLQDTYAGPQTTSAKEKNRKASARKGAENRKHAVRLLEGDFGMKPGSLVMYCQSRSMNTKIARVRVLIHRDVYPLEEFEANERTDRGITGGHLNAQKDRFRRLWRIQFGIERQERKRLADLGLLPYLGRAIELCILRHEPFMGRVDEAVAALAAELTRVPDSPLFKRTVVSVEAARGRAQESYPGGAPSLLGLTEAPIAQSSVADTRG
jgi:HD superfamily phosphohydrolase